MPEYYLKREPDRNGFYEMHHIICPHLESLDLSEFIYIGRFNSCHKALVEAKQHFPTADGCRRCASSCHTDRYELLEKASVPSRD